MQLQMDEIRSPVGNLAIVARDGILCALEFHDDPARLKSYLRARFGDAEIVRAADPFGVSSRVRAYFEGNLRALDDIRVQTGGTPFQQRVWSELRRIRLGTTITYGELAQRIGRASASRAVGAANGQNPIAIVIPCHRVIGANGTLTGYGGGLDRKRWLLRHEGAWEGEGDRRQLSLALGRR